MELIYSPKNNSFPRDAYFHLKESEHWNYPKEWNLGGDIKHWNTRQTEIVESLKRRVLDHLPQIIQECRYVTEAHSFYKRQDYWRFKHTQRNFLYNEQLAVDFNAMLASCWAKFESGYYEEALGDMSMFLKWDKPFNEYNKLTTFNKHVQNQKCRSSASMRHLYVYTFRQLGRSENIRHIIETHIQDSKDVQGWYDYPLTLNKLAYWCILKYELDNDINYLTEKLTHIYSLPPFKAVACTNVPECVTELLLVTARYAQILLEAEKRPDRKWQN